MKYWTLRLQRDSLRTRSSWSGEFYNKKSILQLNHAGEVVFEVRSIRRQVVLNVVCTWSYSGSRGCILHMLGAVPRSTTDDDLHPKSPVDDCTARDSESPLLCLRYSCIYILSRYRCHRLRADCSRSPKPRHPELKERSEFKYTVDYRVS